MKFNSSTATATITIPACELQEFVDGCQNVSVTEFSWNQDRNQPDVGLDVRDDMTYEIDLGEIPEYNEVADELEMLQATTTEQDEQMEDLFNHIIAIYEDNADQAAQIAKLQQEIIALKNKKPFWKF